MMPHVHAMRRVAVIGCPGAGKSAFARQLGRILGTEITHLDRLYWRPGWVRTPQTEWEALQRAALAGERWIIDGNYGATLHLRLAAADTVILLDFPRAVCMGRFLRRVLLARWTPRPDMADGCHERFSLELARFIWDFRRDKRPGILRQLRALPPERVVWLASPRQARRWLEALPGAPRPAGGAAAGAHPPST